MHTVRRVPAAASAFERLIQSLFPTHRPPLTRSRRWLALGLAVAADGVQLLMAPFTVEGAFSPINDGIDIAIALMLTRLVGWNIAFLPSFAMKMVPFVDLAPTWTVAALLALRGRSAESSTPRGELIDQAPDHGA